MAEVRLRPPLPPVGLDARGVDNLIFNSQSYQVTVQPEAIAAARNSYLCLGQEVNFLLALLIASTNSIRYAASIVSCRRFSPPSLNTSFQPGRAKTPPVLS
jgi:hypothetical protein